MQRAAEVTIRDAGEADRNRILCLLQACGLPVADLTADSAARFLVAVSGDVIAGCIGVENEGRHALVRSLAVRPDMRNRGIGSRLLHAAETLCREQGVARTYLLTLTAERFFTRHGYLRLERGEAPAGIAATTEFAGICPASSAFMSRPV